MYLYRYTSRPARIGAVLAHTLREALDNVTVDLSGVEETLADKVAALSAKVDEIQQRLEDYDESIDETPKAKPKAKRKPRARKSAK